MIKGQLFTQHFLDEVLLQTDAAKNISNEILITTYLEFQNIYLNFTATYKGNALEANTETDLIEKFLAKLGFIFSKQDKIDKDRYNIPDYTLFPDEDAKAIFHNSENKLENLNLAIAVAEAKKFNLKLDIPDKAEGSTPSSQIIRYLNEVEKKSVVWGILTNGSLWRLYYNSNTTSLADNYIEFDLGTIFLFDSEEYRKIFKKFFILFSNHAFIGDAENSNKKFLDLAIENIKKWQIEVTENLKEKIFYNVFPTIAQGFITKIKDSDPEFKITPDKLTEIYNNTLIILYRLLFLLYAEYRNLLPITRKEGGYYHYSIQKLCSHLQEILENEIDALSDTRTKYWNWLENLFMIVDKGDLKLKIPPYNGGLFKHKLHPFLKNNAIPDSFLVKAIKDLAYFDNKPINFRDLNVRHLGSIYEGLLEFELKIAETNLKVISNKGKEIYAPALDSEKAIIRKDDLYLTNDNAERKTSGSYYTPDYIVSYIVENTIEPVINQKIQQFEINRQRILRTKISEKRDVKTNINVSKKKSYSVVQQKNQLLQKYDIITEIQKLRILDPAMGSGHFLVGVVDYLADRFLELIDKYSFKNYFGDNKKTDKSNKNSDEDYYVSPIVEQMITLRKEIKEKKKNLKIYIDESKLDDKNLIKRIILKQCIYGVDLNNLAVELAKVSLWLHTFTAGVPLSFLDHHIKCGDSLIGSSPEKFDSQIKDKSSLFTSQFVGIKQAVLSAHKLEQIFDIDVAEIKLSETFYEEIVNKLNPFKKLLDLQTFTFFEPHVQNILLEIIESKTEQEIINGLENKNSNVYKKVEKYITESQNRKFFNWELEFPEVFYETGMRKQNAGFDIVISNPPYVDSENMVKNKSMERQFISDNYLAAKGNWDLFIPFIEKGLNLLKISGKLNMIIPNKILASPYAGTLRDLILQHYELNKITDISREKVFGEPDVYPIILLLSKTNQNTDLVISNNVSDINTKIIKQQQFNNNWSVFLETKSDLFYKIQDKFKSLDKYVNIYSSASVAEAYELIPHIIDRKNTKADFKIVNTGTIDRYVSLWGLKKMKYIKHDYDFPKVGIDKINLKEWTQKPKIIIAGMNLTIEAFLDENAEYFPAKSTSVITLKPDNEYISLKLVLAVLNSKIFTFLFKTLNYSVGMSGGYMTVNKNNLAKIPFPEINKTEIIHKFNASTDEIIENYQIITKNAEKSSSIIAINSLENKIDCMCYKLYELTYKEVLTIDIDFEKVISKTEYENFKFV